MSQDFAAERPFSSFMSDDKYTYKKPEAATVDVTVPSGNVFRMQKPSKYSVLFNIKAMPAAITERAIESWQRQGVGNDLEDAVDQTGQEDKLKLIDLSLKVRDDVLRLSVEPKIVMGPASAPGELSVDDIADEDLDYLFKWVASGGIAAPGVADFRGRPEQDAVDSTHGKVKRRKAVAVSGA